jgi:hypothetical protein
MLAAYLSKIEDDRLGTITLLNTLLDYSEPGVLGGAASGTSCPAAGISRAS